LDIVLHLIKNPLGNLAVFIFPCVLLHISLIAPSLILHSISSMLVSRFLLHIRRAASSNNIDFSIQTLSFVRSQNISASSSQISTVQFAPGFVNEHHDVQRRSSSRTEGATDCLDVVDEGNWEVSEDDGYALAEQTGSESVARSEPSSRVSCSAAALRVV